MEKQLVEQKHEAGRRVRAGDSAGVKELFSQEPELARFQHGDPLLTMAVRENNLEMLQLLLELGCDINACATHSFRPLRQALADGNEAMARFLLENGAAPDVERNAITAVVSKNSNTASLLRLLDEFNANLGKNFPLGNSEEQVNALSMAIQWGNDEAVAYLKEKGVELPDNSRVEKPTPPENTGERGFKRLLGILTNRKLGGQ